MSDERSAWDRYPGYRVDLLPCHSTGRIEYQGNIIAHSDSCLLVKESEHDTRLYFPEADVNWDYFEPSTHQTFCPFKGEASYWSLQSKDEAAQNVVWTYRQPLTEVEGLRGYVSFDTDKLKVELVQNWSGDADHAVVTSFPVWGDAADLLHLLDVTPVTEHHFVSTPYPDPPIGTFIEELKERRRRSVIEGGHQLSQAIVAASKTVPSQRVTSASMIFSKAASFDETLDVQVEVLRGGRNFSTLEVKTVQNEQLRSVGLVLMDSSPADRIRNVISMPEVPGPEESKPMDMKVTGREIRIVDGAYTNDLDHIGPPELYAWIRFRDAPQHAYQHTALMTQATTHWTIAAALRPHPGLSQALAHVSLSTGPLKTDISFHDDVDVTQWMLYVNDAVYSGRGQAQGQGKIFSSDGRLLATYAVHTMIRDFNPQGNKSGHNAM
ncbi:DUF427 domain-containing protein [Ketobacter sp. MCCC 1A13808]|uniref:DUF427 domain-containing protein n=1 Tax=Ketobacter sp. MCCC 1A13808 TaxID=2602738 RepID=UPI000F0FFCCB|nr:DUF427 domain-containing protein [Ketobacter sp. MCCC 1A13808]MVF13448.1 DUF427 domain-containing protein [Ketobacter sp. MCCC 1A13808]RLP52967.1 MAG: DUF427 domain-containing protein [Ketobacter sp.]